VTAEKWREVERLLHSALQLAPAERAPFVANIPDHEVRAEIDSLLAADSEQSSSNFGAINFSAIIGEAAQAAIDESLAGTVTGHFRLLREVGRGGMGVVYLALDLKLERQVALKLLPAGFDKDRERLRRFEREARLTAALNHPNIVTVFEVGEGDGRPFIITEFVEGETLAEMLAPGPLSRTEAVRVAVQILSALAAAHQAGIVHRDLKPANVMVRRDGNVKVLDFGLARLAQSGDELATQTAASHVMGTPAYMAPEQREGKPGDARSDLYAFGCVLYEMLTGKRVACRRPPVPFRRLEKIVSRCLEPDPAQRWQTAADLERELRKAQHPRISWREIGIAAAGVALIVGSAFVWQVFAWQLGSRAASLTDKDVVVLSDFSNTTGDPVFNIALRQALAIQLEQSPFLKILDDARTMQDLRLMGHPESDRIDSQIAQNICVREAATARIDGSISSFGKVYVLTLQAVNCRNGGTLAREQRQAEDKEHVLQAVGKAATALRAKLGESLASIEKLTRPLDQFTTRSLEALQNYARGHVLEVQGQFLASIPSFQRAVELDPNFAMAYMGLSIAYSNAGDIPRSNEHQRKAFVLIDRVSEPERLTIAERYYWQVTGELDKAIDTYRERSVSYPRDWDVHSEVSVLYRTEGEFDQAIKEGQTAVRLEPRVEPPHRNLVSAYIVSDRLEDARQALGEARALGYDSSRLHQREQQIAYIEGNQTAADREIQWYAGRPEEYISFGLQASNADALGRRPEASKFYERAAESARRLGFKDVALDFQDADTLAEAAVGNCQAARGAGRPVLALALCGDAAGAEKLAAEKTRQQPNGTLWNAVQLPAIHAATELRRNRPTAAIEMLASATPYERAFPEVVYLRALAYLRLSRKPEAAAEFRKILDHKGANWGVFYALSGGGFALAAEPAGNGEK
jgi:tetratricopeptide (TPR) repeat protein/aminoglycoside phosphotransferase (APT) family kinase protein